MASETHQAGLEPAGVSLPAVLLTGLAAIVLVVGAVVGLRAYYRAYVPDLTLPAPRQFPGPQVQPDETGQLRELLAAQRAQLAGYAWADRDKGLVRVPIDRAMQLIVQKGEHAFDPLLPASPALTGPSAGAQRAVTGGQGAPSGPASAAGTSGAASAADPNGEAKP